MNDDFDYGQSAELYSGGSKFKPRATHYRRFSSAAQAIQFAVEEMPRELMRSAALEVRDERFEGEAILALYAAKAYPLPRQQP
jgi:hypothetical protein